MVELKRDVKNDQYQCLNTLPDMGCFQQRRLLNHPRINQWCGRTCTIWASEGCIWTFPRPWMGKGGGSQLCLWNLYEFMTSFWIINYPKILRSCSAYRHLFWPQTMPGSNHGRVESRRMHFNGVLRTVYVVHPQAIGGNGDSLLYLGGEVAQRVRFSNWWRKSES